MKKKITVFILCFILIFAFSGCGSKIKFDDVELRAFNTNLEELLSEVLRKSSSKATGYGQVETDSNEQRIYRCEVNSVIIFVYVTRTINAIDVVLPQTQYSNDGNLYGAILGAFIKTLDPNVDYDDLVESLRLDNPEADSIFLYQNGEMRYEFTVDESVITFSMYRPVSSFIVTGKNL